MPEYGDLSKVQDDSDQFSRTKMTFILTRYVDFWLLISLLSFVFPLLADFQSVIQNPQSCIAPDYYA